MSEPLEPPKGALPKQRSAVATAEKVYVLFKRRTGHEYRSVYKTFDGARAAVEKQCPPDTPWVKPYRRGTVWHRPAYGGGDWVIQEEPLRD